jgi:hypothetical protein
MLILAEPVPHRQVDASATKVILVDDLRSFVDGRSADVARASAAAVELLAMPRPTDRGAAQRREAQYISS